MGGRVAVSQAPDRAPGTFAQISGWCGVPQLALGFLITTWVREGGGAQASCLLWIGHYYSFVFINVCSVNTRTFEKSRKVKVKRRHQSSLSPEIAALCFTSLLFIFYVHVCLQSWDCILYVYFTIFSWHNSINILTSKNHISYLRIFTLSYKGQSWFQYWKALQEKNTFWHVFSEPA